MQSRKYTGIVFCVLALGISSLAAQTVNSSARPDGPQVKAVPGESAPSDSKTSTSVVDENGIDRRGAKEVAPQELISLVNAVAVDPRYEVLQDEVRGRNLFLDVNHATALDFAEGYRAVFIPVVDNQNQKQGFLASGADAWTLSLVSGGPDGTFDGLEAKLAVDGKVTLKARTEDPQPDAHAHTLSVSAGANSYANSSCMYVSRYSVSYACWSPSSNPFGYYYVWTYRVGVTPDPRSPNWYACTWGSIHVCPRYETQPTMTFPVCGFPPSHRSGG